MLRSSAIIVLVFFNLLASARSGLAAQSAKEIVEIKIRTRWGGLGPLQDQTIVISQRQGVFKRDLTLVDASLVEKLLDSLKEELIPQPDPANLGIDEAWLKSEVSRREHTADGQSMPPTKGQEELFEASFTNLKFVAKLLPDIFNSRHTDDYPSVAVDVSFKDGSNFSAFTTSQNSLMLPWCIGEQKRQTFNANISHAVSNLLPDKTVNKGRLKESRLGEELTSAVLYSIEREWKLQGAEDTVGVSLGVLRHKYQIIEAELGSWLHPEYGPNKYDPKSRKTNLRARLQKSSFPSNVTDAIVLPETDGKVQGIEQFLTTAEKYEKLVFSIPWLNQFISQHPRTAFRISYVHDASFGEKAMHTFSKDMELRQRQDLISKVRAQQKDVALLMVGLEFAESYWVIFPDKHMVLWRYQGPSGLLKWSPADFAEGECADYKPVPGGCSGREVDQNGVLVDGGTPRDVACVTSWRAKHPQIKSPGDALFEVEQNDRSGLIDRAGNIVIPPCFDGVDNLSENLIRFERDGRWGYLDAAGNVVIPPTFPWAESFHEGLAHVQISGQSLEYDGTWGYIDKAGRVVIAPTYKRMLSDSDGEQSAFREGRAMVEVDGKYGFIDTNGQLVVPAKFTVAHPFSEGLAAVTESDASDKDWGYIDKDGNWAIPPKFDWASSFLNGLAPVNRNKNCGYIDRTGAFAIQPPLPNGRFDCATIWGDFNNGLSRWLFGSKYGFIDRTGKIVIQPQFDLTYGFSEGLAAVKSGSEWGFIDTGGKVVIAFRPLVSVNAFKNGLARIVFKDRGWAYIDQSGKIIWQKSKE